MTRVPSSSVSEVHRELAAALRERLAVIADRASYARDPQAHLRQLQGVSERIASLGGQLPEPIEPRLAHYLERCSYDKALAFLEDLCRAGAPPAA